MKLLTITAENIRAGDTVSHNGQKPVIRTLRTAMRYEIANMWIDVLAIELLYTKQGGGVDYHVLQACAYVAVSRPDDVLPDEP